MKHYTPQLHKEIKHTFAKNINDPVGDCINSGIMHPMQPIGVFATTFGAYEISPICTMLHLIITDLHGDYKNMKREQLTSDHLEHGAIT
mmetsp:Transcript_45471/g.33244  ORF Transcript_45471/g.33244 Transcript_45471/m.33244 type:complete len:89 (+) Transcript_45471:1833-2099(+)